MYELLQKLEKTEMTKAAIHEFGEHVRKYIRLKRILPGLTERKYYEYRDYVQKEYYIIKGFIFALEGMHIITYDELSEYHEKLNGAVEEIY